MLSLKAGVFLVLFISLGKMAYAQDDKIHTDWPDQAEDVHVMKPGQLQLETGLSYTYFPNDNKQSFIAHEMIRFGVVKKLEVRLLVEDGKGRDKYIEETSQSIYPVAAAVKYNILEGHEWLPDMTLSGYLKLPFTSRGKDQSAYWSPALIAAFESKITETLALEYNWGIRQEAYGKAFGWSATGGLQYDLSEKIELFAEYFAQYQQGEAPQHNADAGILWDIKNNLQLDIAGGSSFLSEEANRFVSVGFCCRLGK